MDKYTATEMAFKHGYEKGYAKGYEDGKRDSVKHGHWVTDKRTGFCHCSECLVSGSPQWKRCPVCEAKMDGESQ